MWSRRPVPDILGPENFPPTMGMATRFPFGPAPIVIAVPSVQLRVYRYVKVGGAGVAAAAMAGKKAAIRETVEMRVEKCILAAGLKFEKAVR